MIGRVKKFLGIEGVKLELNIPEELSKASGRVEGTLQFQSMHDQTVTQIRIVLIERYSRGRGKEKLVDEYQLGIAELEETFDVPAGEIIERPFSLSFETLQSDVDTFGEKNLVYRGIAKLARLSRNARSEYRIEAEAQVKRDGSQPF